MDLTTLRVERARFARVCVEVNLKKPLKGTIMVNGERYIVSYEGLNNICPSCGVLGHLVGDCPKRGSTQMVQRINPDSGLTLNAGEQTLDGFTEVRRPGRRTGGSTTNVVLVAGGFRQKQLGKELAVTGTRGDGAMVVSNSFSSLEVDVGVQEEPTEKSESGENKENEDTMNMTGPKFRAVGRNGKSKDGKVSLEMSGNRVGEVDKKVGGYKSGKTMGVRSKYGKSHNLARGLVFGPVGGEPGGVAAGKRLRVEHENIGRAGGAYTSSCTGTARISGDLLSSEGMGEMIGALPASDSTSMDLVLQERPNASVGVSADK